MCLLLLPHSLHLAHLVTSIFNTAVVYSGRGGKKRLSNIQYMTQEQVLRVGYGIAYSDSCLLDW